MGAPSLRATPLLSAQLMFNIGFYAVVPFIAIVLAEDFALGGAAVGLVLGVRTFAQQGMFLVGGALADRCGARGVILAGCAVRVSGFTALALAMVTGPPSLPLFVLGTVLTGLGGALFSPALNTLLARAEAARPAPSARDRHRPTLFALLTVFGETGAAIGPVLGALLLGFGFAAVAAGGALLFIGIAVVLFLLLPRDQGPSSSGREGRRSVARKGAASGPPPHGPATQRRPCAWASLRDRRFVAFAALHAVDLLAYNQLYLALPIELQRVGGGEGTLAAMFVLASALTLTLQLPIARLSMRVGSAAALRTGYLALMLAFVTLGVGALLELPPDAAVGPVIACVVLLILGHLFVGPTALDLVRSFAGSAGTGSYYGLLASFGGLAVLVGNVAIGAALPEAAVTGWEAAIPWWGIALLPLLTAVLGPRLIPSPMPAHHRNDPAEESDPRVKS